MYTPNPPVARVRTATRSGGEKPNQDRIFVAGNAVIVLDGASHPTPTTRDGGWLAFVLGDSPIIAITRDGEIIEVHDDRLAGIAHAEHHALREGEGHFGFDRAARWRALVGLC